jgi:hypothetical protein
VRTEISRGYFQPFRFVVLVIFQVIKDYPVQSVPRHLVLDVRNSKEEI